jgi:hypothetical protein
MSETGGQRLQRIVANIKHLETFAVAYAIGYLLNVVAVAVELDQIDKVADLGRESLDLVVAYVELVQLRELVETFGQLVQLVRVEQELFKGAVVTTDVVRKGGEIVVPLVDALDVATAPCEWYAFEHYSSLQDLCGSLFFKSQTFSFDFVVFDSGKYF